MAWLDLGGMLINVAIVALVFGLSALAWKSKR